MWWLILIAIVLWILIRIIQFFSNWIPNNLELIAIIIYLSIGIFLVIQGILSRYGRGTSKRYQVALQAFGTCGIIYFIFSTTSLWLPENVIQNLSNRKQYEKLERILIENRQLDADLYSISQRIANLMELGEVNRWFVIQHRNIHDPNFAEWPEGYREDLEASIVERLKSYETKAGVKGKDAESALAKSYAEENAIIDRINENNYRYQTLMEQMDYRFTHQEMLPHGKNQTLPPRSSVD